MQVILFLQNDYKMWTFSITMLANINWSDTDQ